MRNRYKGICELCKKEVPPKQGRWHEKGYQDWGRNAQSFEGLRCLPCSTTTKRGLKETQERLSSPLSTL